MSIQKSAIVIMGASGDLAHRKLIPSIVKLYEQGIIEKNCCVLGNGRSEFTDDSFRDKIGLTGPYRQKFHYHQGMEGLYEKILSMGEFEQIIVFMALPPRVYGSTAEQLYEQGFRENVRLIIEKPFGTDLKSARELNSKLKEFYSEKQIYRIDHYLAKESIQNILVFRFANNIFYPVWNNGFIESIQISAFEELGVESRGDYFDGSGIIRDMIQNHLFQLLALLTMEAPVSLKPEEIRLQKMAILKALEIKECKIKQYEGYQKEPKIPSDSETETYAEMKLEINSFRWTGVPIYIRTGKAVGEKMTSIAITLKKVPRLLFNQNNELEKNKILIQIQPDSSIIIDHSTKIPGSDKDITTTDMDFCYSSSYNGDIPDAYQKLLQDALKGDQTLFVSAEETELSWEKIQPFLDMGNPGLYRRGRIPKSELDADWVDMSKYASACHDENQT
ncbi:glucose-6-phosphate dehydrogenase [Oceanispirochaeta sp.]|jgi:glucose-6-phosphate 1-dehydrogenase|uniref:glucose-6-phosphate dehydrogenase n=1 Tax=Oceanispirochaeta sp. TaxID=2035350 RepID=UPI0026136846|nr:glucose-6-phosphate dehydrogenase [Oceanispirochaeta sp.]MDA3955873.1 glucose-6-phosphate dehydrogenase [Oceanispirochaeta sp.]